MTLRGGMSPLVRLALRLISARGRKMLHERVSPELITVAFLILSHIRPLKSLRRLWALAGAASAHGSLKARSLMIADLGSASVVATVSDRFGPHELHREPLDIVTGVLVGAGIPHFRVRGYEPAASAVAVPEAARADFLHALRKALRHKPFYLGAIDHPNTAALRPTWRAASWRRASRADIVSLVKFRCDRGGRLVLGAGYGCEVEFWREETGHLHAPRPNRSADRVPCQGLSLAQEEAAFTQLVSPAVSIVSHCQTREEFTGKLIDQICFPIDVVYTWVDGSDSRWRAKRDSALSRYRGRLSAESANESRYASRDELRYSMRSLALFAPWVNRIWLVTDEQIPAWLEVSHDQITIVDHRDLFSGRGRLPTFNSHAIETQLHQIPGLSEHFLYFNDDVLLGRAVFPNAFFEANGLPKVVLSTAKVDPGPVLPSDTPATAAGKNNRALIAEFGSRVSYKVKHCPHPLRRSILAEIEKRFTDAVESTAARQFRHPADVSLASSLYQYYALATERAVPADLRYMYADVAHPSTPRRLAQVALARDVDVMCLNDTDSAPGEAAHIHRFLTRFMDRYFPVAAPWEKST